MDKYDGINIDQLIILHLCAFNVYMFLPHFYMRLIVKVNIFIIKYF